MKKIMKIFVLVAAAAMALASCQKNEINGPVNKEVHFTIKADAPQTKTSIADKGDKTYTPSWTKGDEIGVFFAKPTGNGIDTEFENESNEPSKAVFKGTHSFTANEDGLVDGYLYAFYPSKAFNKTSSDGDIRLDLSPNQKPTSTSFDPDCDLLVAAPCHFVAEATGEQANVEIDDLYFARLMAVLRINLNSEFLSGEVVKSVSFKADDQKLCGGIRINPETAEVEEYVSTGNLSTITATYSEDDPIAVAGQKNSAYLVIPPVTIPENTSLTFTIETENYDIVKTVTSPKMTLSAGNVNVINLTIEEENCEEKVEDTSDYSGSYIIVAKKDSENTYYYMSTLRNGELNGNNRTAISSGVSEITDYTASKTDFPDVDETCVWNVSATEGGYILSNIDNSAYLYTENDNRAYMGTAEQASIFAISVEENVYTVTATEYNSRVLSFNTTSNLFACYASGQNPALALIPYVPDTTPRINVEKTEYTADAAATSLKFTYTTKNITGNVTATVKENPTMKDGSAVAEGGTVTVNFAVNTEASEKTATIVLSYTGAESKEIIITQAAAGQTKQYYVKVTTAPNDWSGTYLMVCDSKKMVLSGISTTSTKYGIGSAVEIADNKIEATETLASYQVVLSPGSTQGSYLMKFKDSYLYWGSGNSLATNTSDNSNTNWLLSASNGNVTIKNCKDNTRVIVWNASSPRFACYTSSQTAIQLYRLETGNGGGGDTTDSEPENPGEGGGENPTPEQPSSGSAIEFTFTSSDAVTKDGVTVTFAKGNGQNDPGWNNSSNHLRLYASNTIVVSAPAKTITKIEYVFTKQGNKDYATASGGTSYTSGGISTSSTDSKTDTWIGTVTNSSVTVTLGSSGQRVIKSIKVYAN